MNTSSMDSQRITTPFPFSGERIKGGEKRMASEWEELMEMPKEDLVIELVRSRYEYRLLKSLIRGLGETGSDGYFDDNLLSSTSPEWARIIAEYVVRKEGSDVTPYDMNRYGVDDKTAEDAFESLYADGTLDRPED